MNKTRSSGEKQKVSIVIKKADTLSQGFAAYEVGSLKKKGKGVVLLNVYATLSACIGNDISIKEQIIESLMHEFGHVMEEFYDKEFDEDFIEWVVESYREKYADGGLPLEENIKSM